MSELIDLGHYSTVNLDDWAWANFRPFELRHRHDDHVFVRVDFLDKIQLLRSELGFGLEVSSYYRSKEYDKSIGGAGVHPTGEAIDLLVSGENAYNLIRVALEMSFTGIGINQRGPWSRRFVHLDTLAGPTRPRVWTYG